MTGITVKFGSRHSEVKPTYTCRYGPGMEGDMFVEVNGGISRISSRPYASCYYYMANEIRKQDSILPVYQPVILPNYDEVVADVEGRQFQFVRCTNTDSTPTSLTPSTPTTSSAAIKPESVPTLSRPPAYSA